MNNDFLSLARPDWCEPPSSSGHSMSMRFVVRVVLWLLISTMCFPSTARGVDAFGLDLRAYSARLRERMPFLSPPPAQENRASRSCLDDFSCPFPAERPDLPALLRYTVTSGPEIASARADLRGAEAGYNGARWAFAPTPGISISSGLDGDDDDKELVASLDQPLWTGGRLSANLRRAGADIVQGRAALEATRFSQAESLIEAYGNWASAWFEYQAWMEGLSEHDTLVALVERRVAGGASGRSELNLALNRRNSVNTELIAAEAARQLALAQLTRVLGQPLGEPALVAALSAPRELPHDSADHERLALDASPFIARAKAQLKGTEAAVKSRRASLYPSVSLQLLHEREEGFWDDANEDTSLSVRVSSNFGAGLSRLAEIRQVEAEVDAARAAVSSTERSVVEQVRSSSALLRSAKLRVVALEQVVRASQALSLSYRRQFQSGRRSWEDVMNSAREVANNKAQLADARATQLMTSWKLGLYLFGPTRLD